MNYYEEKAKKSTSYARVDIERMKKLQADTCTLKVSLTLNDSFNKSTPKC